MLSVRKKIRRKNRTGYLLLLFLLAVVIRITFIIIIIIAVIVIIFIYIVRIILRLLDVILNSREFFVALAVLILNHVVEEGVVV